MGPESFPLNHLPSSAALNQALATHRRWGGEGAFLLTVQPRSSPGHPVRHRVTSPEQRRPFPGPAPREPLSPQKASLGESPVALPGAPNPASVSQLGGSANLGQQRGRETCHKGSHRKPRGTQGTWTRAFRIHMYGRQQPPSVRLGVLLAGANPEHDLQGASEDPCTGLGMCGTLDRPYLSHKLTRLSKQWAAGNDPHLQRRNQGQRHDAICPASQHGNSQVGTQVGRAS